MTKDIARLVIDNVIYRPGEKQVFHIWNAAIKTCQFRHY